MANFTVHRYRPLFNYSQLGVQKTLHGSFQKMQITRQCRPKGGVAKRDISCLGRNIKILARKTDKFIFAELRKTQLSNFSLYPFLQKQTILNYEILGTGAWKRYKIWGRVHNFLRIGQRVENWGGCEVGQLTPYLQARRCHFAIFLPKIDSIVVY